MGNIERVFKVSGWKGRNVTDTAQCRYFFRLRNNIVLRYVINSFEFDFSETV